MLEFVGNDAEMLNPPMPDMRTPGIGPVRFARSPSAGSSNPAFLAHVIKSSPYVIVSGSFHSGGVWSAYIQATMTGHRGAMRTRIAVSVVGIATGLGISVEFFDPFRRIITHLAKGRAIAKSAALSGKLHQLHATNG